MGSVVLVACVRGNEPTPVSHLPYPEPQQHQAGQSLAVLESFWVCFLGTKSYFDSAKGSIIINADG